MEMSWITAISQLNSQIINLFGNAILKLIHIRLFDLLTRYHYILNSPRTIFVESLLTRQFQSLVSYAYRVLLE